MDKCLVDGISSDETSFVCVVFGFDTRFRSNIQESRTHQLLAQTCQCRRSDTPCPLLRSYRRRCRCQPGSPLATGTAHPSTTHSPPRLQHPPRQKERWISLVDTGLNNLYITRKDGRSHAITGVTDASKTGGQGDQGHLTSCCWEAPRNHDDQRHEPHPWYKHTFRIASPRASGAGAETGDTDASKTVG
jgi:hypothetical protein